MPKAKKKKGPRNNSARCRRSRQVATAAAGDPRLDRLLTAVRTHPDDVPTRLDLAEHYWNSDQTKKIAEALEGLESQYPFADKATRGRYNVLAAFGHAHRNQPVEAEKAARRGLEEFPNTLDFQFVLAFVHLSLREYDQVIQAARAFLESCKKAEGLTHRPPFCSTADNIAQVYNFLGAAYGETNRVEESEEYYRLSMEADPGDHRPYLNLIRLLRGVNRLDEAQAVTERGLAVCRQVQELRMFSASHLKKATVSACMMVKNEEELLPEALDSVRDWVDEIIVVDTGSTDKTVEIAESYGAKVFHQEWEADFSKHRNYTVELANSEWVFIIDADERFDQSDVPLLLKLINSPENEIISINVFNLYRDSNDLVTGSNSVRFWRKSLNLRYEGIVHNALDIPDDSVITRAPISLEHVGYDLTPEKMEAKSHRTMALLQKQLDENPRNGNAWFNVAQLLRGRLEEDSHELADEALDAAKRAVEYTDPDVMRERGAHVMALNHVAWIANLQRDYHTAEEYAKKALELKPDYLDPLMLLGNIQNSLKNHSKAIEAWQKYLDVQATHDEHLETLSLILYHSDSRATVRYRMGMAWEIQENIEKAKDCYKRALEHAPGLPDAALRLGRLYLAENKLAEAENLFKAQQAGPQPSAMAVAGLGNINALRGDLKQAEEYYQLAVEMAPDDPTILTNSGLFYLENGNCAKAIEYLEKALSIDENQTSIKKHLAELHFGQGHYQEASHLLEQIIKTDGEEADLLNDLGNCFFKQGKYETAESYYREASGYPNPPTCLFRNLGLTQARLNRPVEAIASLEKYLDLEPGEARIAFSIGDLKLQTGDYAGALASFEQVMQSNPVDILALFKLAECYRLMGHRDSAALGYQRVLQLEPEFAPAREKLEQVAASTTT